MLNENFNNKPAGIEDLMKACKVSEKACSEFDKNIKKCLGFIPSDVFFSASDSATEFLGRKNGWVLIRRYRR